MPDTPITAARFELSVDGYSLATFKELAGLQSEVETVDYIETDEELRLFMLSVAFSPATLRLGRPRNTDGKVRAWYESSQRIRPSPKKMCMLTMYDVNDKPITRYRLENGWPSNHSYEPRVITGRAQTWETVTLRCSGVRRA